MSAKKDIQIDGNTITPADLSNLIDIQKAFREAKLVYGFLSPGAKQLAHETLEHLIRCGNRNTGEVIEKIKSHNADTPTPGM